MKRPDFRVRGIIFATLFPGEEWGVVKLTPELQAELLVEETDMFEACNGAWGRSGATIVFLKNYAATVLSAGTSELDPYGGKLPTTQLIRPAFRLVVKQTYINVMTGQPVPAYDPATDPNCGGGGLGGGLPIGIKETPDRTTFMSTAHVLLAMVFGYAGSNVRLVGSSASNYNTENRRRTSG